MEAATPSFEIDIYRWGTTFATLSLDVAAPYVPQMGLQLPAGDVFKPGLRRIIEEFRRRQTQGEEVEELFSPAVFEWAQQAFNHAFAAHLYAWGQNVFQTGEGDAQVFFWNNIVRRGGLTGAKDTSPPPPFVVLLRQTLAGKAMEAVNRLAPITGWDVDLYQRQQYDSYRNPMELVQATINYYNFVSAWQEASRIAGTPNLQAMKKWGMTEVVLLGIPLDALNDPGDWPSLPAPWEETGSNQAPLV